MPKELITRLNHLWHSWTDGELSDQELIARGALEIEEFICRDADQGEECE